MSTPKKTPHPHFDDRGALSWHTKLADALAEAKATGKFVFIEFGRFACGSCFALVETVLPQPPIAALLNEHFVCVASDCDHPEPEVMQIGRQHMPHARSLPFVLYLDSNGNFLYGTTGGRSAEAFKADLDHVLQKKN